MHISSKNVTSLASLIGMTFYSINALAAITTSCSAVSTTTQCIFSGQGSNLSTLLINALNTHPGALTLIIQTSNNLSPLTITKHNNVTIELGANVTLTAPSKTDSSWKNHSALISVSQSTNFVLQGDSATTSTIDGQGAKWWSDSTATRPYLLDIDSTMGIILEKLQFLNSPKYNIHITNSSTIAIQNLAINAPSTSPNTDGINTHAIQNMTINTVTINNGDDGIAVNSDNGPSNNIQISNITLINGHGISIGSQVYNPVTNMTVDNVTITNAQNGLRIKTRCPNNDCSKTTAGSVSNIFYQNITLDNVGFPILYDLDYSSTGFSNVQLSNITYKMIRASHSNHPATLLCAKTNGCSGLVFDAVSMDKGGQCQGINGGSYTKVVACPF